MQIVSLNIGKPKDLPYNRKIIQSGILKAPAAHAIFLTKTGFEGDGQADLVHHGGVDKAVCVYAQEHFPYWQEKLNRPFHAAAFGENITSAGLLESSVHIGDTFQLGEAVVQVSQPRQPCFKLAALYEEPKMPLFVKQSGYTGFYFRVLQEGTTARGMEIIPLTTHSARITVQEANRIMNDSARTEEDRMKLLQLKELAESWKEPLRRQAERL